MPFLSKQGQRYCSVNEVKTFCSISFHVSLPQIETFDDCFTKCLLELFAYDNPSHFQQRNCLHFHFSFKILENVHLAAKVPPKMQKKWAKINHAGHCLRQLPVYKETISGLFTKLISGDYCRQYEFLKFLARVFSQQEFLTKVRAMNILSISLFPTMRSCINHKLRNCVFI